MVLKLGQFTTIQQAELEIKYDAFADNEDSSPHASTDEPSLDDVALEDSSTRGGEENSQSNDADDDADDEARPQQHRQRSLPRAHPRDRAFTDGIPAGNMIFVPLDSNMSDSLD